MEMKYINRISTRCSVYNSLCKRESLRIGKNRKNAKIVVAAAVAVVVVVVVVVASEHNDNTKCSNCAVTYSFECEWGTYGNGFRWISYIIWMKFLFDISQLLKGEKSNRTNSTLAWLVELHGKVISISQQKNSQIHQTCIPNPLRTLQWTEQKSWRGIKKSTHTQGVESETAKTTTKKLSKLIHSNLHTSSTRHADRFFSAVESDFFLLFWCSFAC